MFKSILSVGIYFLAMLLIGYYFMEGNLIKAVQFASLMTILHVVMHLIDRIYKRRTNKL